MQCGRTSPGRIDACTRARPRTMSDTLHYSSFIEQTNARNYVRSFVETLCGRAHADVPIAARLCSSIDVDPERANQTPGVHGADAPSGSEAYRYIQRLVDLGFDAPTRLCDAPKGTR